MPPPSTHPTTRRRQNVIEVKGACTHNLKNIDVKIPHRTLTVITGLSGSGKTSLAFDTLFADWNAKYLQTFDAYTRQLMGKGNKPPVDYIKGILPSIGLKQKSQPPNPRIRVGQTADIYPYLKLLYARAGITYSPITGDKVKKDTISNVVDYIKKNPSKSKVWILSPLHPTETRTLEETLKIELSKGFTRILHQGTRHLIEELLTSPSLNLDYNQLYLVIDRLVLPDDKIDSKLDGRLGESVHNAFFEGMGSCNIKINEKEKTFSDRFEADGMTFPIPSPELFDSNNPHGACNDCHGFGRCMAISPSKIIPDPTLSLAKGAVAPWRSFTMNKWQKKFLLIAKDFPFTIPYQDLSEADKKLLWKGSGEIKGIDAFFEFLKNNTYKKHLSILQARYRTFSNCSECQSTGLRKEASYVKIGGKNIIEVLQMNILELRNFFDQLTLPSSQQKVTKVLLKEIKARIKYLIQVGLNYLTLLRKTNTLSAGEYQRIRLARGLSSSLIDTLYILDEPTAGLHPKDIEVFITVLKELQRQGNTIIVTSHNEKIMRIADQIIDIGPEAGSEGGEVVFQGSWEELIKSTNRSLTVDYLRGKAQIPIPIKRRTSNKSITFQGISEQNIRNENLTLPLHALTLLTGVSGAGKSTLIKKVIYPALKNHLNPFETFHKNFKKLQGNLEEHLYIELVNQDALGKSSRSNPATYTKAYDDIRKLFAQQPLARERNYTPSLFSFNIPGGRCEPCMGEGVVKVEMQFTPDISITCDNCQGRRFKQEVLDVTFQKKTIQDILRMTVTDSIKFFQDHPEIANKLKPLQQVGLGYLQLGQSSSTFSGGEAQRVKLSTYLGKKNHKYSTLFIFDEPTKGLHFHDTHKLINAFQELLAQGHTVIVVEHNLDLIKCADHIIDIGPEGGDKGGKIIFEGTPEQMVKIPDNYTAYHLRQYLEQSKKSPKPTNSPL